MSALERWDAVRGTDGTTYIVDTSGETVARTSARHGEQIAREHNAHAALVQALKDSAEALARAVVVLHRVSEAYGEGGSTRGVSDAMGEANAAVAQARAALSLAEGRREP